MEKSIHPGNGPGSDAAKGNQADRSGGQMLKAVLLDLDNTLVLFNEQVFYQHYFELIAPWFADIMPSNQVGPRLLQATRALLENNGQAMNVEFFLDAFCAELPTSRARIWERFHEFYATDYDNISVPVRVPDQLCAVLDKLAACHLPLVVASNPVFPRIAQEKRLAWSGLGSDRFHLLTHIENMSYVKPRLGYFRQICTKLGLAPKECLMVGNDPSNDMAAGAAGLKTYLTTEAAAGEYASLAVTAEGADQLVKPDYQGPLAGLTSVIEALLT